MGKALLLSALLLLALASAAAAGAPSTLSLSELCGVTQTLGLTDTLNLDDGLLPSAHDWAVYGSPGAIVDLGTGNKGLSQSTTGGWAEWLKTYQFTTLAMATRFRIDSESSASDIVQLAAKGITPEIAIGIRNHRLCAINYKNNTVIADLGAITPGQFYEAGLFVQTGTNVAGWWLDGVGGNTLVTTTGNCGTAFAEFGAATYDIHSGASAVTFDWVGVYVPEPSSLLVLLAGVGGIAWRRRAQ